MGVCQNVWSCIGLTQQVDCHSACGRILSHNDGGKYCAVPASTLRKCALKFHMATSAILL